MSSQSIGIMLSLDIPILKKNIGRIGIARGLNCVETPGLAPDILSQK